MERRRSCRLHRLRTEPVLGAIGGDLDAAGFLVGRLEEQLAGSLFGGDQVLRPQGDCADAGALKSESVMEVVGECRRRARVSGGFGQLAELGAPWRNATVAPSQE